MSKKPPTDEPQEEPRRKKRKKAPTTEQPLFDREQEAPACAMSGCQMKAVPGGKYCVIHEALQSGRKAAEARQRQANRKGDTMSSMLWSLGGVLLDAVGAASVDYVNKVAQDPGGAAQQAQQRAQQAWQGFRAPAPPPPPPKVDPFVVLGLDPAKATAADVRMMQKKLASIYHADKASAAINKEKLAEINAAADACLQALKKRG